MTVSFFYKKSMSMDKISSLKEILESGYTSNAKGCWNWRGKKNHGGYGCIGNLLVHRLSYAIFNYDFPNTSFICHHCDNPSCYNPNHLYEGDSKSNGLDAKNRKRKKSYSLYRKD